MRIARRFAAWIRRNSAPILASVKPVSTLLGDVTDVPPILGPNNDRLAVPRADQYPPLRGRRLATMARPESRWRLARNGNYRQIRFAATAPQMARRDRIRIQWTDGCGRQSIRDGSPG